MFFSYQLQEEDPNQFLIAVGGGKIHFAGKKFTPNSDITTSKCLLNSVISTKFTKLLGLDINDFYLTTALDK